MSESLAVQLDPVAVDQIRRTLNEPQPRLPSEYFYDEIGSQIFDEICELDEYYPTRTEHSILSDNIDSIVDAIGSDARLIEYGSGSSLKTRLLLQRMHSSVHHLPLDISGDYLMTVAEQLRADFPDRVIEPHVVDFTSDYELPPPPSGYRDVVYFPGSTIGNFARDAATALLRSIAKLIGDRGQALIGFDLRKDVSTLIAAYDDSEGVTARFNRNILRHVNRVAGTSFDLDGFEHHVRYNTDQHRIEMHLRANGDQTVSLGQSQLELADGDTILTEYSHKYTIDAFADLATTAELVIDQVWTDPSNRFAMVMLSHSSGSEAPVPPTKPAR